MAHSSKVRLCEIVRHINQHVFIFVYLLTIY